MRHHIVELQRKLIEAQGFESNDRIKSYTASASCQKDKENLGRIGLAWGFVLASFLPTLMPKFQLGMLTQEDLNQVMKISHDGGDEIRDAIHKLG
jgi:hypothetical protein